MQATAQSPILFGGIPAHPSPEVFEEARRKQPVWFRLLESAVSEFAKKPENVGVYADPFSGKGATVEQVWLFFTVLGIKPYCLLAYSLPDEQTARIERLIRLKPPQAVAALKKLQKTNELVGTTTMIYDGQSGHCISVKSYDGARDRFVYYDSWPLNSMLSRENNVLSIDAQNEGSKTSWSVSAAELESVIFASMLYPESWARVQGIDYDQMFDVWTGSDFFKFFHVKQSSEALEEGIYKRKFSIGPFEHDILLQVDCLESGKIVEANLFVDAGWTVGNWMMALDLVKSFVVTFAPPPDLERFAKLAGALWDLANPESVIALKTKTPHASVETDCLRSFMGIGEPFTMIADFAVLSIGQANWNGKLVVRLRFDLG